jgi:putative transposase
MPRRPRLVLPGVPIHLVQRGVDRQACFFDDADRHVYLDDLAEIAADVGCAIHAYFLMTNHVYLLLTPASAVGPRG